MKRMLVRIAILGAFLLILPGHVALGEWWWCAGPPSGCVNRNRDYYDGSWCWVGREGFYACNEPPTQDGSKPSGTVYTREVQTYCESQTEFGPLCWHETNGFVTCPF